MRKVLGLQFILFILVVSLMNSCTKSSPVGSELLAGDQADIQFTDTLTLRMRTVKEDSVIVHDPFREGNLFSFYLLGDFNDPVFGNVNTSIYSQLKSSTAIIIDSADFQTAVLDSMVLSLVYDPNGVYGNINEPFTISVHRLTEDIDPFETYYSDQDFEYDPIPLATHTFTPNVLDSLILSDTIKSAPQLRIPLGDDLAEEFLSQESPFTNLTRDSAFISFFKGLYIKADTETGGTLSFNLATGGSAMSLYFTTDGEDEPIKNRFTYSFSASSLTRVSRMNHTFSSSVTDAVDGGFTAGEQAVYLQALAGPLAEIEIPFAREITSSIINKAELEFTISVQDTSDFPYPEQIVLATRDSKGTLLVIDDVDFALNKGSIALFGGQVEDATSEDPRQVYKMNIAAVFQDMADDIENNSLFLRILPKQEQASRVILYGPEHSEYPAKLNLTYTRLSE